MPGAVPGDRVRAHQGPDVSERLLQHARELISLTDPREILVSACREAVWVSEGQTVFASYALPGRRWEQGIHVSHPGDPPEVPPRVLSALFALHRRVALAQGPVTLARESDAQLLESLAPSTGPPFVQLDSLPLRSHTGRLLGELTVARSTAAPAADHTVVAGLGALAVAALETIQRVVSARRDQERLQLLAEASREALWDWDIAADDFWWGGAAQSVFGDQRMVQNDAEWKMGRIHPEDRARVRASLERAIAAREESSWIEEYRLQRRDGARTIVEDRAFFLRETDGRAYRAVGAVRDISTLKRLLEREQQARTEAEQANRAKDDFLAMLGHELRNPLAAILGATDLLRHREISGAERERTIIERQTQHLTRLVDDLLDVSRVASGKIEIHTERVELSELATKAIEMARSTVEERGHELVVNVPARGLTIEADPARFIQVLCNLLNNAAKYTPPGGRITVDAKRTGDSAEIEIADNGIGIEPAMLGRVFDMFVQEHQALDRAKGGLGLGLSIVRSLVALHGGSVEAHSIGRGRGSRFTVTMPLVSQSPTATGAGSADGGVSEEPRKLRILLVDDNFDAVDMLTAYLGHLGHTTAGAHDGTSALALVDEFAPEVVLLDVGLPGMNGYDVARTLRQRPDGQRLRLIAVTGYGQESDRLRAREAGFDVHVVKPIRLAELHQLIQDLTRLDGTGS